MNAYEQQTQELHEQNKADQDEQYSLESKDFDERVEHFIEQKTKENRSN